MKPTLTTIAPAQPGRPLRMRFLTASVWGAALVLFLVAGSLQAAGTSAAQFLKIGTGARGAAMGDAQVAIADDVTASYWNPAGLSQLRFQELSLMHYDLIESVRYQQAVYGVPSPKGTFAVGLNYLDFGSIQGYDAASLPTGHVDARDTMLSLSWARRVMEKEPLSFGANFKYLQSDLAGYNASAPMFDVGADYPFESGKLRGLRLGAALRNVGPAVKYDRDSVSLPRQAVLGAGFLALGGALTVATDLIDSSDSGSYFAAGVEYRLFDILRLRVGYNGVSNFVGNGVTYGLGLRFTHWNLDYAFVPYGDLGNTSRFSVGVRFGHALEITRADEQVEMTFREAQQQYALGNSIKAYGMLNDLLLVAPWHRPSVELKAKIEKRYQEMSVSKDKTRMEAEIADAFTRAKDAFDRDELVEAKKGFETILLLQPDHVGSKVYLERIKNRYASLAQESFKQGMAYYAAGDYENAKLAFEKTLTIDPNHADAKAQLETVKQVMADSSKREAELQKTAGAADAYKEGLALYQKNDLEGALSKFEQVKALVPEYEEVTRYIDLTKSTLSGVLFEQARVLQDNGQLEEAVAKLKRANEMAPTDTRISQALEVAKRDLSIKNAEESRKLYKEGLEAFLGGQTQKAEQLWRHSLELDSTNEDSLKAISKLEEQKRYGTPDASK